MAISSFLRPNGAGTLWPFGTFCGHLVYVFPFWYVVQRKIWQPWKKRVSMYIRPLEYSFDACFSKALRGGSRKFCAVLRKKVMPNLLMLQIAGTLLKWRWCITFIIQLGAISIEGSSLFGPKTFRTIFYAHNLDNPPPPKKNPNTYQCTCILM
jgi:hypothetical protein